MSSKPQTLQFVQFSVFSDEDIRVTSVCQITRPTSKGGIDRDRTETPYDERMGVLEEGKICLSCRKTYHDCPGHFGYIELPVPIYNKFFMEKVCKILHSVCYKCSRPRILPEHAKLRGLLNCRRYKRLKSIYNKSKKIIICPWDDCGETSLPYYYIDKEDLRYYYTTKDKSMIFTAGEAWNVLSRINTEHARMLGFNDELSTNTIFTSDDILTSEDLVHSHQIRPESLIFTTLPVIPPVARPYVIQDGEKRDDDLTDKYNTIIKICNKLNTTADTLASTKFKGIRGGKVLNEVERQNAIVDLQKHVWTLMDNRSEKSKLSNGGKAHKSIFERIQGKEGRVRGCVSGKRVDFSGRTVIGGGGILLECDQVGIPQCIAEELTTRHCVNEWNFNELQYLVTQGQITKLQRRDPKTGKRNIFQLSVYPEGGRQFQLQIGDYVELQLQDDDVVVMNRQPTLRKESMMSFRVKVLPNEYIFRLPLAVTSPFNADFDGDEMNTFVPRSYLAISETSTLMRVATNIVTPQKNSPICGIVQDGLVSAYLLTNIWLDSTAQYTMVSKAVFQNCIIGAKISDIRYRDLLYRAQKIYPDYINEKYEMEDEVPGKILASILFPANFCYTKKTNTNTAFPIVKIEHGILLPDSGPLCKNVIGGKSNSIVHALWKEYSPEYSIKFLSETQFLTDHWLPHHGFSMGISDCLTTSREEIDKLWLQTQAKVDAILQNNPTVNEEIEGTINTILNSAINIGTRIAKNSMNKGERNALNIMRLSGAKGSVVNLTQIAAYVGQQNVGGLRVPFTLSGNTRALPHFRPNDHSADAKGFVSNSYMSGQTPTEAFFHAAGGREGVIATAIKSVTGDTPIFVLEYGEIKRVQIGNWIDAHLEKSDKVQKFAEREMELLDLEHEVLIPTVSADGHVSWEIIKAITRHDPGDVLYRIQTKGGRSVIVTESKSLLIWDKKRNGYYPKESPLVQCGDLVPVTKNIVTPVELYCEQKINKYDLRNGTLIEFHNDEDADFYNLCQAQNGIYATYEDKHTCFYDNNPDLYETFNMTVGDPIISIELVDVNKYPKVYDLTVPSTLNFGLANGMHVVDTADTGYIQNCIGRKVEDHKACIDGSVRDSNGNIIQFLYGGDGMDAQKLYFIPGLDFPIFINPLTLADRLNSDAIRMNEDTEEKIELDDDIIDTIFENIICGSLGIQTEITKKASSNIHKILRPILKKVKIYPSKLITFCIEIRDIYEHSKIQYGECVGLITSESVGEVNTQLTLNVFHLAGVGKVDVTIGVPRLQEILNTTKRDKQKTPSCKIYFNEPKLNKYKSKLKETEDKDEIRKLKEKCFKFLNSKKTIFEEIRIQHLLKNCTLMYKKGLSESAFHPINVINYNEYNKPWWVTLYTKFNNIELLDCSWILHLHFDLAKLYNKKITLEDIVNGIIIDCDDKFQCIPSPLNLGIIEIRCDFDYIGNYIKEKLFALLDEEKKKPTRELLTEKNVEFFSCKKIAISYIKSIKLCGIQNITKAYSREDTDDWVLDTKGSNLLDIMSTPEVELNTSEIVSNDMWSILSVFGIEAARNFLFEEFKKIISFDGTYINARHIDLLVDSMTYTGTITSVRRDGIPRDVGPIAKLMFEKAIENCVESAIFSEYDPLNSVSAAIMFGKLAVVGTGMVNVRDIEKTPIDIPKIEGNEALINDIEIKTKVMNPRKRKTKAKII